MDRNNIIRNYKDLIVWQKSVDLAVQIYQVTNDFPKSESYGLTDQLRRASVSIASNIAEGCGRQLRTADQKHFLRVAYGSAQELETQLIIAHKLKYLSLEDFKKVSDLLLEVIKMLSVLIFKFK